MLDVPYGFLFGVSIMKNIKIILFLSLALMNFNALSAAEKEIADLGESIAKKFFHGEIKSSEILDEQLDEFVSDMENTANTSSEGYIQEYIDNLEDEGALNVIRAVKHDRSYVRLEMKNKTKFRKYLEEISKTLEISKSDEEDLME
ncbi:MAG: hypothetical protein K2Q34_07320 [Alphaproteobacteria bacterium]|nr:hypothetical protein [Alphaproteobacteria bacterium]